MQISRKFARDLRKFKIELRVCFIYRSDEEAERGKLSRSKWWVTIKIEVLLTFHRVSPKTPLRYGLPTQDAFLGRFRMLSPAPELPGGPWRQRHLPDPDFHCPSSPRGPRCGKRWHELSSIIENRWISQGDSLKNGYRVFTKWTNFGKMEVS